MRDHGRLRAAGEPGGARGVLSSFSSLRAEEDAELDTEIQRFIAKKADLLFAQSWKPNGPIADNIGENEGKGQFLAPHSATQTLCLRAFSKRLLNSSSSGLCPLPWQSVPCPPPSAEEPFPNSQPPDSPHTQFLAVSSGSISVIRKQSSALLLHSISGAVGCIEAFLLLWAKKTKGPQ